MMKVMVVSVMYEWERHEVDDQLSVPTALLELNACSFLCVLKTVADSQTLLLGVLLGIQQ